MRTTLGGLRDLDKRRDEMDTHRDFLVLAACIMATDDLGEAYAKAQATNQSERVQRVLKAAQSAGTVANTGATIGELLRAFIDSAKYLGAFDRIAGDAMRVDLGTRRVSIFTSITASTVTEGAGKPVRRIQLTASDFTPSKVVAQVVMTKELILALTDEGIRALGRELRTAVAVGSDTAFLSALSGESSEGMGVDTFAGALDDIEELLRLVRLGVNSKPYLIVTPELGKALAVQATGAGISTLGWNGGEIAGVQVVVSDAQTADRITAVDAAGLAVAMGPIDLRSSGQAAIEMDTSPTQSSSSPTATSVVSMFQTNSRCLLAERSFAVKAIRPNAYAHMTVALGEEAGSPALT